MTERREPAATAPAVDATPKPTAPPRSANKDLAAQISGADSRMVFLPLEDLTDADAEQLAQGDPPLTAIRDVVRQLWAVTLAPTT
jgi:hypothetical protein